MSVATNGFGRLAPSPTGAQHLGNARTYLIASWAAQATGRRMRLRIEDVDSPRVKSWAVRQAIDDLAWLGIQWTGPIVQQTQRLPLYDAALKELIVNDRVYPCTCSRKDIEAAGSAPHFDHEPKIYPGTCSRWRDGDTIPSQPFSWRFRSSDQTRTFVDEVMGSQAANVATQLGDFPITQKDGSPSYQLAVVVDDAAMQIDQVVRGNDLIASAFRQLDLYDALGYVPPSYAHVPLVCGPDGRRLAKRHGDTRLSQYREQGIAPERIIEWANTSSGLDPDRFDWSDVSSDDTVLPIDFGWS